MAKAVRTSAGIGPLNHPEIATRIQEGEVSQRYLIAVWSVTDDPDGEVLQDGGAAMRVNYTMISNGFPSMDLPKALAMFTDSISDFQLQALRTSDNVIRNVGKAAGEMKMAARPTGVVSKKGRKQKVGGGQKKVTLRKPKGKKK